jgi:DNA-directed RNA polymerase specialized sigma24 family protein
MTTAQDFNTIFEAKYHSLKPYLCRTAGDDEDLIQEGAIGLMESLKRVPDARDQYLRNGAKWAILRQHQGKGKSVDIRKSYKRKTPISIVHYDGVANTDAVLSQAVLADRKHVPLDELVIQKVDFDKLRADLSAPEEKYVRLKVVDEMLDKEIAEEMGKSKDQIRYLKRGLRSKIEAHFAG